MAENSPKHSVETWNTVKLRFESGSFTSLKELATEYSINPITLRTRMVRESWNDKQRTLQNKVELAVEKQVVSKAEEYLSRTVLRMEKYEKIIDASIDNLGSKTPEGVPLLDPEAIDQFTRSETRISALSAFAHRIAPIAQQVDVKATVEHSLVSVIAKLRDTNSAIDITPEQMQVIRGCDVEPKSTQ